MSDTPTATVITRALAVARFRLAIFVRSLRFVPPLLGELAVGFVLFSTGPQAPRSAVDVSAAGLFAIGVWCAVAGAGGLSGSGRDITLVSAGRGPTLAGELLADAVAVVVASGIFAVMWAGVVRPTIAAGPWLLGALAVASAGLAGAALGELVGALRLEGPARFVLAIGLVCLTFARPALADGGPLARFGALLLPPVLSFLRTLEDDGFPDHLGGLLAVTAGCLVWTAAAVALTALLGARRIDRAPSAARAR